MSRYTIQSAVKVLDTLFAFGTRETLSMEELAQRTNQSRNQAFRCVRTLEEYGLLAERDGGYVLTPMLLRLMPSLRRDPIATISEPYLRELQQRTDETVNLVVRWNQFETITLATFPSRHSIRLVSETGQVSLLHAGATPKAMLAFMSEAERDEVLSHLPEYPRYTEFTQMDPTTLKAELDEIRRRGYSISDQDFELGGRGVGAAIFNRDGEPVAGLSIGGPTTRVGDDVMREWAPLAVSVARAISTELGWSPQRTDAAMASRIAR